MAITLSSWLEAPAVAAAPCCAAHEPDAPGAVAEPGRRAAPWSFMAPAAHLTHLARAGRADGSSKQFDYRVQQHVWLTGGVHMLPTGIPFSAETSNADRTAYSQAGLGLGYTISPAVRAISCWSTGLGRFSATPGRQFTVGVSLYY
ncbi:hypothetical protein [Hymenobacter segetis]|uniref:Outer membrane protein beta-barrel domain-containing protein n=1 Tax=Hymenobacter segetis TaxID=2025509 RepID=A0ABU9LYY0_9BACT